MAKLSKSERSEIEQNLATCRSAVATFEKMLKDDDEATKAAGAASHVQTIQGIAKRDGVGAAIYAIREHGRRPGETE